MNDVQIVLPLSIAGDMLLPSALVDAQGRPRFHLPLGRNLFANNNGNLVADDGGLRYLVVHETRYNGYERPSRQFFDDHLASGDVFLDVGAHWGIFSLSAASRWPGGVRVLAIEPHPQNVMVLLRSVGENHMGSHVEVVAAAAGAEPGLAPLNFGSTMGHSLVEASTFEHPRLFVSVVRLDDLVASRPELGQGRVFIKIDVEGYEYEVIQGTRRLLDSGRVAAVMWEKGVSYNEEPGNSKMRGLIEEFRRRGFTLHRFPSCEMGGPLIPFACTPEIGNVFALAPGFPRKATYDQPFEKRVSFNALFSNPSDPQSRSQTTRLLKEAGSSDGARWADPAELTAGADERAALAARWIAPPARVLDLGAGAMCLEKRLPPSCHYQPADLIARSATCHVVDLNQGQFPPGRYDVVVLLEVLEYVHDPAALLKRARESASRLICSYQSCEPGSSADRRAQGWFHDYSRQQFADMLQAAGWYVAEHAPLGQATAFCSR